MRWGSSAPAAAPRPPKPTIEPDLLAVSLAGRQRLQGNQQPADQTGPPRPVFVLGPLRSGASLLTLSLSQHPNLYHVLETNWFEQFGMGLQQSFSAGLRFRNRSLLDVAGIEIEDFFAYFGESVNQLMLESAGAGRFGPSGSEQNGHGHVGPDQSYNPGRWLDGTTSNSFCVFVLLRLFPHARFIHVVRDLHDVIDTLTTSETRGTYKSHYLRMPEEKAYRHWIDTTRAVLNAEKAFGSNVVRRVRRDDLILAPDATLRTVLDFIDEPFSPLSMRPYSSVTSIEPPPRSPESESALSHMLIRSLRAEGDALNDEIFAETPAIADIINGTATQSTYQEDLGQIAVQEMDFSKRARWGISAVPSTVPGFSRGRRAEARRSKKQQRSFQPLALLRSIIDRD